MDIGVKWWKVLVIVVLLEVAFFTGAVLRRRETVTKKETEYIVEEKKVKEPVYINKNPNIPEKGEKTTIKGIGVHSDNETGEVVDFKVTLAEGNGEVYLEVSENSYGPRFQASMEDIKESVEELTQKSLNNSLISVRSTLTGSMKGSSGSLAIGVGLYSLVEDKKIKEDTAITGVLYEGGEVGSVALLEKKIKIAREKGIKNLLIPPGEKCEDVKGNGKISQDMNITCVNSLEEAVKIATKNES